MTRFKRKSQIRPFEFYAAEILLAALPSTTRFEPFGFLLLCTICFPVIFQSLQCRIRYAGIALRWQLSSFRGQ